MPKWPFVTLAFLSGLCGSLAGASDIIVTTLADTASFDSQCSLREAIVASNLNRSGDLTAADCIGGGINDQISFSLRGVPLPWVITVGSALPQITEQVTITGTSGRIRLAGPGTATGIRGLDIRPGAAGTTISRLVLHGFTTAIWIEGANSVITANFIGTDATGTTAAPNGTGILVLAANVRIGGTAGVTPGGGCTGDCNLVAASVGDGIRVEHDNALIQGNLVGTNVSGTATLGNGSAGVALGSGGSATVGGTTAAAGNLFSGNVRYGVLVTPFVSGTSVDILGNRIGTNAAGTAALANGVGVWAVGVYNTPIHIGGPSPGAGNVISGNTGAGVHLEDITGVSIQGNRIGTLADGLTPLANGGNGVDISVFALRNLVGGDLAGEGNVITSNAIGVRVASSGHDNSIRGNSIHDNLGKGIEIVDHPDYKVPAPVISGINPVAGSGCVLCRIDVYSDAADEGRTWHGATSADGAGNWTFPGAVDGPYVTATATSAGGGTSEFSAPRLEDSDGDALADIEDNCTLVANANQLDANNDGYGNICDADLDNSGLTTVQDFNLLRSVLNQAVGAGALAAAADMNGSGTVTTQDYNLLRARLNTAPGPSGLHP